MIPCCFAFFLFSEIAKYGETKARTEISKPAVEPITAAAFANQRAPAFIDFLRLGPKD
jgi:hypothetical protein